MPVLIRRETAADIAGIRAVTAAAFARPDASAPVEVTLLDELRTCSGWLPQLSLVATDAHDDVVGHVVCTRGHVDTVPALALGPLSVHPDHQRRGVGRALVHSVLGAADALGEPLVALLGNPQYYGQFGFRVSTDYGITPPNPAWADYFQVRMLTGSLPAPRGVFAYADPFTRI